MDDGSLQNKGLHLSVYAFSYEEVIFFFKYIRVQMLLLNALFIKKVIKYTFEKKVW